MKKDLSFDHQTAAAWSMPITLVAVLIVALPHVLIHREEAFGALLREVGWLALPGLILAIVVHELLHTVTVMACSRLSWSDVSYGINWKTLTPYAHPRVPVTARAYVATAAMPGVVLGLAPSIAGLVTGSGPLSAFGALMLAAAAGDALIIWSLRGTPLDALVQDHPSRVGCYVVDGAAPAMG